MMADTEGPDVECTRHNHTFWKMLRLFFLKSVTMHLTRQKGTQVEIERKLLITYPVSISTMVLKSRRGRQRDGQERREPQLV